VVEPVETAPGEPKLRAAFALQGLVVLGVGLPEQVQEFGLVPDEPLVLLRQLPELFLFAEHLVENGFALGESVGDVDQAVKQLVDGKDSCRRPMSEKAVAVKTTNTFWVRPKMAGMESRANRV
jgi:hypothetical protein